MSPCLLFELCMKIDHFSRCPDSLKIINILYVFMYVPVSVSFRGMSFRWQLQMFLAQDAEGLNLCATGGGGLEGGVRILRDAHIEHYSFVAQLFVCPAVKK